MARFSSTQQLPGPREVTSPEIIPLPLAGAGDEELSSVDFRRYWHGVRKRWWILVLLAVVAGVGAAAWSLRQPKVYRASATILIDTNTPRVLTNVQEVVPIAGGGYYTDPSFYEKQYLVIRSLDVARRAAEFMRTPPAEEEPGRSLRGRYSVVQSGKTAGVVRVIVEDQEPEFTADLANAVARAYTEANLENRVEGTREAGSWLSLQHADLKQKLERSEDALYGFLEENDILNASLETQLTEVKQRLNAFNANLAELQAARIRGELDANALREARDNPALIDTLPAIQASSVITNLKQQLVKLRSNEQELAAKYKPAFPRMVALREQIQSIEADLAKAVDAALLAQERELASLENTERGLKEAIAAEREREARLNKLTLDFTRLQRDVDTNERMYQLVTSRMKEADLTGAMRFNNVRVLEEARVPGAPFKPNVRQDAMLGLLAGLLLGLMLALLLEFLDSTIKSQEDVEATVGAPFLGIMPVIEPPGAESVTESLRRRDLFVIENPKSTAAESARFIRTNLLFMGTERDLSTLVVTSAGPQEGKTTTAVATASAMAMAGSRTLIIDTDMRRPRLHRVFGASSEVGLSSVILGEATLDDAIRSTEQEGLDVLVCGPTPPNPSEILHSQAFRDVVRQLMNRYDRLIFDSPPVGAVADPVILGAQADGVVFVLKCNKTTRDAAKQSMRALDDANAHVVGAILNDVDMSRRRYGGAYYRYYSRYGGYYGEDEEQAADA